MSLKQQIADIRNTKDVENLVEILGPTLGKQIYALINEAEFADKELDIVHRCITKLYNYDCNVPEIKKCLKAVARLTAALPSGRIKETSKQ